MYPKNIGGLLACYAAGIPFIHNTIFSDALFTTVLFGTYYLLQENFSSLKAKSKLLKMNRLFLNTLGKI